VLGGISSSFLEGFASKKVWGVFNLRGCVEGFHSQHHFIQHLLLRHVIGGGNGGQGPAEMPGAG
jgi:hypothetical protein